MTIMQPNSDDYASTSKSIISLPHIHKPAYIVNSAERSFSFQVQWGVVERKSQVS